MTTEEKAKAYDEALERARKQRDDYQKEFNKADKSSQLAGILRAGICAIELAFPELKESEDERIRKAILGLTYIDGIEPILTKCSITAQDIRTYLEKQKDINCLACDEHLKGYLAGRKVTEEKQKELPFVKDVMLGYPGLYFYDGERMHFQGNPAMEEKQKESLHISETCKDVIVAIEKYLDWLTGYPDYSPKGKYSIQDMLHCLYVLEKQKESSVWENPIMTHEMIMEKQKGQKPMYNLEIPAGDVAPAEEDGPLDEDEFLDNELSAFLQNYDKEYDDDAAVSDVAKHFYEIGKKQKEQKPTEPGPICGGDDYDKGYRDGREYQLHQVEQYSIGKTFMGLIPCWINAPSTLQPAHRFHGRNAVIMHENNGGFRCVLIDDEKAAAFHLPENTLFVEGWRKKPAEWSEEDIKKIRSEEYTKGFNDAAFGDKLKEWSEEDEKTIDDAYCWLCEYAGSLMQKNREKSSMLYGIADKLKSLPPQSKEELAKMLQDEYNKGKAAGKREGYTKGYNKGFKDANESVSYHFPVMPTAPFVFGCDGTHCTNPHYDCINCPRKDSSAGRITTLGTGSISLSTNDSSNSSELKATNKSLDEINKGTMVEQKSVEWSEEDKTILEWCIADIERAKSHPSQTKPELCDIEINWLKALNLKKRNDDVAKLYSNEWSEEDAMLMDELESYILYDKEFNDEQKSWRIKRLKSFRPQPHCKISDELDIDTLRDWSMRFAPDIREAIEATAYHFYNIRPL